MSKVAPILARILQPASLPNAGIKTHSFAVIGPLRSVARPAGPSKASTCVERNSPRSFLRAAIRADLEKPSPRNTKTRLGGGPGIPANRVSICALAGAILPENLEQRKSLVEGQS